MVKKAETPHGEKAPDLPTELVTACATLGIDPAGVPAWRLYGDKVVVIAPDGRKLEVER